MASLLRGEYVVQADTRKCSWSFKNSVCSASYSILKAANQKQNSYVQK